MLKKYSEEEKMFRHYKNCKFIGYVNEMPEIYYDLKFDEIHNFVSEVGCFGNLSISVKRDGEIFLTTRHNKIDRVMPELLTFKRNDKHAMACLQEIEKELDLQKTVEDGMSYDDVHDFMKQLNDLRISYGMDEIPVQEHMEHLQIAY